MKEYRLTNMCSLMCEERYFKQNDEDHARQAR